MSLCPHSEKVALHVLNLYRHASRLKYCHKTMLASIRSPPHNFVQVLPRVLNPPIDSIYNYILSFKLGLSRISTASSIYVLVTVHHYGIVRTALVLVVQ